MCKTPQALGLNRKAGDSAGEYYNFSTISWTQKMLVAGGSQDILEALSTKPCSCLDSIWVKIKRQNFITQSPQCDHYCIIWFTIPASQNIWMKDTIFMINFIWPTWLEQTIRKKKMQRAKIIIPLLINHRKAETLAWKGYNFGHRCCLGCTWPNCG